MIPILGFLIGQETKLPHSAMREREAGLFLIQHQLPRKYCLDRRHLRIRYQCIPTCSN